MLAQLSETLAIAPSALGSTCRLTAKRGGRPFRRAPITSLAFGSGSPVIRGGRDHMSLGFMILYLPNQMLRFEPCHLVSHSGRPARDRLCTASPMAASLFPSPALGEPRHRSLAR